ncbi:hypothetical protein Bca52824_028578 [Brassica carinata]|uniref:F-box associated beta-propeller type 3 domain-containing protein n=1 Tax=Brassica carinata TaxID=52824 RepID=A0A8X8AN83_BRACI|nr:hypothetical protein Bca52824_028578 [Brassica carinata]
MARWDLRNRWVLQQDRVEERYIGSSRNPGEDHQNVNLSSWIWHDGEMGRLPRRHGSGGPVSETKKQKMEYSRRPSGQSLTLPRLNPRLMAGVDSYVGFDPVAKEFKLLLMNVSSVAGDLFSVEHQVLTLGTKNSSWRLVECCIPHYTSRKWICILYYAAAANSSFFSSMVVCFDLRSEKFSFVNFLESFNRAMHESTTLVNYNGRVGLLMSEDSSDISQASKSFDMWVLQDAEWSRCVYVLPPSWKDVVTENMRIIGMVGGTNEIVLSPRLQYVPSYIIYFNVESKRIRKVGIKGLESIQGKRSYTYLNYVENVKLL